MTKYEVNFTDNRTGAKSAIDVITAIDNYDADDYIRYCRNNADDDWNDMLANGTIELTPVVDAVTILMADRCTKSEAERHLKLGTIIFDSIEEYVSELKKTDCYNGETVEDIRAGKCTDISAVTYAGHEYCIEYVR